MIESCSAYVLLSEVTGTAPQLSRCPQRFTRALVSLTPHLRRTEAHWAVITGITLWLSIPSSWITSHIISTFVHARWCHEAPHVWHVHKSKSNSPFGLRLLNTSYLQSHAVKYVLQNSPRAVPRANRAAWQAHISMFYIASFMHRHVYINHVRRARALQQQSIICVLTAGRDKLGERASVFRISYHFPKCHIC